MHGLVVHSFSLIIITSIRCFNTTTHHQPIRSSSRIMMKSTGIDQFSTHKKTSKKGGGNYTLLTLGSKSCQEKVVTHFVISSYFNQSLQPTADSAGIAMDREESCDFLPVKTDSWGGNHIPERILEIRSIKIIWAAGSGKHDENSASRGITTTMADVNSRRRRMRRHDLVKCSLGIRLFPTAAKKVMWFWRTHTLNTTSWWWWSAQLIIHYTPMTQWSNQLSGNQDQEGIQVKLSVQWLHHQERSWTHTWFIGEIRSPEDEVCGQRVSKGVPGCYFDAVIGWWL